EQPLYPMPRPPKRPRCRHLALEALEPRAVPAAMPLHVVVPLDSLEGGQVQAAALQPDGTLELLGTRRTDTLHPWRWILSPHGKLLSNSGLPTLSDHETGAISRASADGSKLLGWLAGISDSHLL